MDNGQWTMDKNDPTDSDKSIVFQRSGLYSFSEAIITYKK